MASGDKSTTYRRHATLTHYLNHHDHTLQDVTGQPIQIRGRTLDGNFVFRTMIIHACVKRAFVGPHLVELLDHPLGLPDRFWVHSLTCIKRKFLGFTDTISFERSAYVTLDGSEYVVSDIRPYITFQRATPTPGQDLIWHSREKQTKYRLRKSRVPFNRDVALTRSRRMMEKTVQKVVCSYHRDMDDVNEPHIDDVCELVEEDVKSFLERLSVSYGITWAAERLVEVSEDQRVTVFVPIVDGNA